MPRKSRIEFAGAHYPVINRGNYTDWIFKTEGARRSFLERKLRTPIISGAPTSAERHNDYTRLRHNKRTLQPDPCGVHSTYIFMGVLICPHNLDAIIAVGYRVYSYQATQFRIWATKTLKKFVIKGFVIDDHRHNDYTRLRHNKRTLQPDPCGVHSTYIFMGVLICPYSKPCSTPAVNPQRAVLVASECPASAQPVRPKPERRWLKQKRL
jgi:hypothetical protein